MENCIFENNAINTCTVSMDGSLGFEVRNSIFRNNSVTDSAFECDSSVGVLSGLLIYGNSGAGIGIINADKGITILNSTIVKNSGGAIRVLYNNVTKSVINITNSILWNIVGKEVTINNPAPATFINISHTIIRGGTNSVIPLITTVLNLDAESIGRDDPMFVDSGSNDYSLSDVSKAIGSGISSGTPGYDLMGVVRPTPPGSNPDLGAIESILSFPVARLSNLSSVSGKVGALLVLALGANNNPLHYSAAGLPSGLTLDETSGLVNGTPLGGGVFKTVIAITNRGGTTTNLLTFEISKALPTISWNVPTSITWGQPLDASTYLATSETAGSFSFDPPIGSVLDVGSFTLNLNPAVD